MANLVSATSVAWCSVPASDERSRVDCTRGALLCAAGQIARRGVDGTPAGSGPVAPGGELAAAVSAAAPARP